MPVPQMRWLSSGPTCPRPYLFVCLLVFGWLAEAERTLSISRTPPGAAVDLEGVRVLGYPPQAHASSAQHRSSTGDVARVDGQSERIFLDLSMCFDRAVSVVGVDVYVSDPSVLHAGRLRWHVLSPIPSHGDAPTQWFRLTDAWPAVPAGLSPKEAFPEPGAYRLSIQPRMPLGWADCIGWSIAGSEGDAFAFEETVPAAGAVPAEVAWAEASEGLHDVAEMFVKRGERPAPHISWTGIMQRKYSVRLLYVLREEAPAAAAAAPGPTVITPEMRAAIVPGGNPACWRGGFTFEHCCGAGGEDPVTVCWDHFFTFDRCCTLATQQKWDNLKFRETAAHYDLHHLVRGNLPRLGPVQDDEALLLYALVRAVRPKTIVEFGTANGFSSINWMHAIAEDDDARVFSYDILPYPVALTIEDADPRFIFIQKSQADFHPTDVENRPVDVAFFDAGHLVEYSVKAFERVLPSLTKTAIVVVHDTGLHVADHGTNAPPEEEGLPFSAERCARTPGGAERCRRFPGCEGEMNDRGNCIGRAHRPSERRFVREVVRRWPEFRPIHLHSRRVFRHGLTMLQRGELWDPLDAPDGDF